MDVERLAELGEEAASYEIRRRSIIVEAIAEDWRGTRRRASLSLALLIPILIGLLAASFFFLTRSHITGGRSLFAVCALGGLLASTLLAAAKLAEVIRTRSPSEEQLASTLVVTLVPALASGAVGGLLAASTLLTHAAYDSYRPQTLYLIAFALTSTLFRFMRLRVGSVSSWRVE
jgi:hypothetical protein